MVRKAMQGRKRAFTLIEIIVVVVIVAILVAILVPVASRSIASAQISDSNQRLKQMHLAVELYRIDYEGTASYSHPYEYGLPTGYYVFTSYLGLGQEFFQTPCGDKSGIIGKISGTSEVNTSGSTYAYFISHFKQTVAHFQKHGPDAIMFVDLHCNPGGIDWRNNYESKRGLGVTVGGRLVNFYKMGDPGHLEWWLPE